ncbi:MAG: peptidoglycan-binding protein [Bryobacterales bacterium]|nr:peptidoglycan-binding protein [Bryobacterales bacterium]
MPAKNEGNVMHTVVDGDTLVGIADQYGFRNWEIIWNHEKNAPLRAQRPDPQILLDGDSVWVPKKEPKLYECETTKKHTFRLKKLWAIFRAKMKDENGTPYGERAYKLTVDGQDFHGKTDGEGLVEQKVPPRAKTGDLTLWPDPNNLREVLTWKLQLGHLDPAATVTGVQARLKNLGYYMGELDGQANAGMKAALAAFQSEHGLAPTGELDEATSATLEEIHDVAGSSH